MQIKSSVEGHRAAIELAGKLTVQSAPDLIAEIKGLDNRVNELVIDLAEVEFIASAGLRALVTADKMVANRKGSLRLLHPTDEVLEVFDMTGLMNIFEIER